MPFTNRNNNSSQRAGRGLGPCGAEWPKVEAQEIDRAQDEAKVWAEAWE